MKSKKNKSRKNLKQIKIYVEPEIHNQFVKEATLQHRSLTNLIEYFLATGVGHLKPISTKKPKKLSYRHGVGHLSLHP